MSHTVALIKTKVTLPPERLLPLLHALLRQLQPDHCEGANALRILANLMESRPFLKEAQLHVALIEELLVKNGLAECEHMEEACDNTSRILFFAGLTLRYLDPCNDFMAVTISPDQISKVLTRLLADNPNCEQVQMALKGLSFMVCSGYLHRNAALDRIVERLFTHAISQPLELPILISLLHSMTAGGLGNLDRSAQRRFSPWFEQIAKTSLYRKVRDGEALSSEECIQVANVDSAYALLYTPIINLTQRSFFTRPFADVHDQRSEAAKAYFDPYI